MLLALLGLLGVLVALAIPAGPAAAHSELVSSSPKDGARLAAPPDEVTLTFSEELLPGTVTVVAADDTDSAIPLDAPTVEGAQVTVAWPARAAAGAYSVSYRVVSADGHPVTGTIRFAYAAGSASPNPSGSASGSASATTSATTSASTSPSTATSASAATPTAGTPSMGTSTSGGSSSPLPWILAALVVVGVAIAAAIAVVARRRAERQS